MIRNFCRYLHLFVCFVCFNSPVVLLRVLLTVDMCVHVRVGSHELADYWRLPHLILRIEKAVSKVIAIRLIFVQGTTYHLWAAQKQNCVCLDFASGQLVWKKYIWKEILLCAFSFAWIWWNILSVGWFVLQIFSWLILDIQLTQFCQMQQNKPKRSNKLTTTIKTTKVTQTSKTT